MYIAIGPGHLEINLQQDIFCRHLSSYVTSVGGGTTTSIISRRVNVHRAVR